MSFTGEEWRVVARAPRYEVSDRGRIRHSESLRIKRPSIVNGNHMVALWNGVVDRVWSVQIVVAEAFLTQRPARAVVHHIDGNRANNEVANLQYISRVELRDLQRRQAGLQHRFDPPKLDEAKVAEIRKRIGEGDRAVDIALSYGVSVPMISQIKNGKRWKSKACDSP